MPNLATHYEITNNWDDRTLCGLDLAWVNDSRNSSHFKTLQEASDAADTIKLEHDNTLYVSLVVIKWIEEGVEYTNFPIFSKSA